ncbi:MAG TPA: RNA polymerase sigma factor [Jatrophihabitans sp.]|jgi:RNA polymerase sigma-70 factor (ECF subfamily)
MSPARILWERAVAGDPDAFGEFYERHADRVFAHCSARGAVRADAEDLTAEVFTIAWRRRSAIQLHDEADILPWLLVTANNLLSEHRRSSARIWRLAGRLPVADEPDVAIEIADRDEFDRERVRALDTLRALRPADREVIELCVMHGLSAAAVAAATGRPASTVRTRLARALTRARAIYGETPTSPETIARTG